MPNFTFTKPDGSRVDIEAKSEEIAKASFEKNYLPTQSLEEEPTGAYNDEEE